MKVTLTKWIVGFALVVSLMLIMAYAWLAEREQVESLKRELQKAQEAVQVAEDAQGELRLAVREALRRARAAEAQRLEAQK